MAEPQQEVREKLAVVFARQDFYEACLRRDSGAMISILNAGAVTQGEIAARTGLAQSTLSNYKRGVNTAQFASTFEKLADGLDMPPRLRQALGLTEAASPTGSRLAGGTMAGLPADTFDLQLIAEATGRTRTPVKRRDLLALTAQLGATAALEQSAVWDLLTHALTGPGAINETLVRELEARTTGFYLLEEIIPAQAVLKVLTAHLREVSTLLSGRPSDPKDEFRQRLIVAAGESSLLAGWSASALGDSAAARNFYDTAVRAAEEACDPAMTACALAYRSYAPKRQGRERPRAGPADRGARERFGPVVTGDDRMGGGPPRGRKRAGRRQAAGVEILAQSRRSVQHRRSRRGPSVGPVPEPGPVRHLPSRHVPEGRQVR
jgi:transcriptional regulator with XRE-family HTH domain